MCIRDSYKPEEGKIVLCLNLMKNVLHLKENLDRELMMSYDDLLNDGALRRDDKEYACSAIRACRAELNNYGEMNEENVRKATFSCAKYMVRNRGPNVGRLPYDSWVRYANRLVDENSFCFAKREPYPGFYG
eukprot:TRINITY_DN6322_c0_g1_i2.p1 TRINITY_DN6322_c0_g1~~TRINITY_DN6322_c0_g1_i2.p1  ORF type:complete len:152 (+),score=26.62 TRINITY_DN6322_c0_g1_i2:61-456(+)